MRRSLLRSQLSKAWRETVYGQYQDRLINSERGLQVYFCAALLRLFTEADVRRRIFVEPRVSSGKEYRHPDIVICNTQKIIGVVEFKYLPRSRPKWKKDIGTLEFVASNPAGLEIANDRYRGLKANDRRYPLAPDAVLCWGAVYTGKQIDLRTEASVRLRERLLQLHAVTTEGEVPDVEIL